MMTPEILDNVTSLLLRLDNEGFRWPTDDDDETKEKPATKKKTTKPKAEAKPKAAKKSTKSKRK